MRRFRADIKKIPLAHWIAGSPEWPGSFGAVLAKEFALDDQPPQRVAVRLVRHIPSVRGTASDESYSPPRVGAFKFEAGRLARHLGRSRIA
jgi:hypothetical protein